MLLETKEKFPQWCRDKETNYKLLLSDDIDSFMCYILQKELFNREIEYFIDVNYKKINKSFGKQVLYSTNSNIQWKDIIGLDIALENNIKCWDNHVTKQYSNDNYNLNSANMNNIINVCSNNYTSKFVISSFITMLSYYDVDITKWNKEQLAILCCIDGLYTPFCNQRFMEQGKENLRFLGYEFLSNFIKENLQYIIKIESEYNIKYGKICTDNDGFLQTNIDLLGLQLAFIGVFNSIFDLPHNKFMEIESYKSTFVNLSDNKYTKKILNKSDRLMNFALLFKNKAVVSYDVD
ncbi:hypothetical protein FDE76_02855 [Clostridium botulinum]|uniref:Uncharacterized protein n=1 Tax=Clostridium botulinum (strain Eklund 17B / Type B) TaxID=935198 RepID=B2TRN1_CLOBB|nr:hypothetical protein [Clostridium sp. ZBS18]ACD22725.1 conserved hypothetical protein [Clostridium botulinum B str. Eklund 17B (NRP)]MBN1055807.1 hypothetical protein [Clostridium botulinum]MBY6975908.1 hypothetical protein [Clostridium botulinum]MBY7000331.1 hypothetical protein [Clostridium botulinum]MCR1273091.1 hypothetical protein [Clostridium botulinum]